MAKTKIVYVCSKCGNQVAKWMGQCPSCHAWNTLEEREEAPKTAAASSHQEYARSGVKGPILQLKSVSVKQDGRILTGISELDRVLGGGIVRDSISIIAAKPGAGKSTLLLQIADSLSHQGHTVLYVSGRSGSLRPSMKRSM